MDSAPTAPTPAPTAPEVSSATPAAADEAPAPAPVRDAEDLLLRANRLRAERRWADAEQTYAQVLRAAPGSDAAYAAAVAAAALRLERLGRPQAALELYERALADRPGGALAEEAAFGVAECRRALGDAAGEAQALRRFLADWPSALMAGRARARLEELVSTTGP
jgi:tetratricopeptide (TPR) repeat protein